MIIKVKISQKKCRLCTYMKYRVPETMNPRNLNNAQIFQTEIFFLSAIFQTQ